MSGSPKEKNSSSSEISTERVVYVIAENANGVQKDVEFNLLELWRIVWRGRWIVFAVTLTFVVASVVFALVQTEWYRAEVLLAPAEEKSTAGLGGQLGGLAALAGVSIGGGGSAEAIAVLNSREFAREFIEKYELTPLFFHDQWDDVNGKWHSRDPGKQPDIRDAVLYFHDKVLSVAETRDTGLVTLAVEWTDPENAARWARELVIRLNEKLRERALKEAETNVAFLQMELARTSVLTLQQSIGRLLESELQKLMLARGNEEFAFRVIDGAFPPNHRFKPNRALIAVTGTLFGLVLSVLSVLLHHAIRSEKTRCT